MHLPVTALDTVLVNERRVLLVGQGPHLHVYDCVSNELLASQRLFDVQPIHHIACLSGISGPIIVAVGGSHVVKLTLETRQDECLLIKEISASRINAKEWVLKVHSHGGDFISLTTNNALFRIGSSSLESDFTAASRLAQGPGASLYSGDFCTIDAGKLLVAAGSVFGEVLIWTCQKLGSGEDDWVAATTHRVEGHTGSIFGVRISPEYIWGGNPTRFVLSCSDDRTVQLWDVSDYDEPPLAVETGDVINTGFGQDSLNSRYRVAMGWGHQSRIWDVDFLGCQVLDERNLKLQIATRGEDGTCQYWTASLPERHGVRRTVAKLSPYTNDRHHSGKNVWAWTQYWSDNSQHIVSGGADGRVASRDVAAPGAYIEGITAYSIPFNQLQVAPIVSSLKEYAIVNGRSGYEVLALTSNGEIIRCRPQGCSKPQWQVVVDARVFKVSKLCARLPPGLIIAATTESIVIQFGPELQHCTAHDVVTEQVIASIQLAGSEINGDNLRLCITVTSMSGSASILWVSGDPGNMVSKWHRLRLPDHFIVTSSCYDYNSDILVLGSRAGAVALITRLKESTAVPEEALCIRHVHGSDAVTSLQFLPDPAEGETRYLLSTGRNGRFSIHCIGSSTPSDGMSFATLHCASTPFGPHIEGATIVAPSGSRRRELILHGFRSKDFVVWNETRQTEVFSVDCGGAHRSWAYSHDTSGSETGDNFVWTKAGTFNLHSESRLSHRVIREGGHGREIKALAVCPRTYASSELELRDAPIFATGAEDTSIRIFAARQAVTAAITQQQPIQLCQMSDHTAGLQDMAFSSRGNFLFSCGGAEQLFAWSISYDLPLVGVGSVLQDKMPQTDEDSDVRIMGISVSNEPTVEGDAFHIAAAYSNGKVKLLSYVPGKGAGAGHWHTHAEVLFGSFCLMQVHALGTPSTMRQHVPMLTAGTNGFINLTTPSESHLSQQRMDLHSVHQSSILALDVVEMWSNCWFVATGGDDNALALTTVRCPKGTGNPGEPAVFATVRIPHAHAAATTAIKIFSADKMGADWNIGLVSAGDDQRVNIWQVTVPIERSPAGGLRVVRIQQAWTAVADVSNIDLVGTRLLVAGVGIEILDLDIDVVSAFKVP